MPAIMAFLAAVFGFLLAKWKWIAVIFLIWFALFLADVVNIGPFQWIWPGPAENARTLEDSDGDGILNPNAVSDPGSADVAPFDGAIALTVAQATATATAQGAIPPTPTPMVPVDPNASTQQSAVPTMVAQTLPTPTPVPTQASAQSQDMVECVYSDGRPSQVIPRSQCGNVSVAGNATDTPQTVEDVRSLLSVSPEVQINDTGDGWILSTLGDGGMEFSLSLPAGVCVDFDPTYEKIGAKQMLPADSYEQPAPIDAFNKKRVKMVRQATLEHISIATVRWNSTCSK